MKNIFVLLLIAFTFLSCAQGQKSIIGSWESKRLLIVMAGKVTTIPLKKGDLNYHIWTFDDAGILRMSGNNDTVSASYRLQRDTLFITATNGFVNAVPVMQLSRQELHLRHLSSGDNVVEVFRRQK